MRIGIDGRYIQDHFPGIGRYTYSLIEALARVAGDESFIVLHNPALRNTRYDVAALARYNSQWRRYVAGPRRGSSVTSLGRSATLARSTSRVGLSYGSVSTSC
jgi:hypothetical protein